jgi:hypothetical protein
LRFQGLGAARAEDRNWEYDAVARRDRRIAELNNATPFKPTLGEVVGEVVEAVKAKVRKPTKTAAAVEWLSTVLRDGPVPQRTIEALAVRDSIGTKPLKIAKAKLKVQSTRKGRSSWAWMLPFKKAKDVEGQ